MQLIKARNAAWSRFACGSSLLEKSSLKKEVFPIKSPILNNFTLVTYPSVPDIQGETKGDYRTARRASCKGRGRAGGGKEDPCPGRRAKGCLGAAQGSLQENPTVGVGSQVGSSG